MSCCQNTADIRHAIEAALSGYMIRGERIEFAMHPSMDDQTIDIGTHETIDGGFALVYGGCVAYSAEVDNTQQLVRMLPVFVHSWTLDVGYCVTAVTGEQLTRETDLIGDRIVGALLWAIAPGTVSGREQFRLGFPFEKQPPRRLTRSTGYYGQAIRFAVEAKWCDD